jgi:adenylyltransferase/sulfurtransferase
MRFSNKELEKFSKQIVLKKIGAIGQKKIMSSKILVIGAGGLGCTLMLYLVNTGISHIGIADSDIVELSNLNRQILFTTNDIGKLKVVQAKKFIKKINKKAKINIYKKKINKSNVENIIKDYDIICDGTDNFKSRYLINDYCLKNKKILISAAISKFSGQIFNFNFKKKTPCFRCFMPEEPNYEINCDSEGIIGTLVGIAGSLQANEVINTILNNKDNLNGKMLIFNSLTSDFRKIKLSKNSACINKCLKR